MNLDEPVHRMPTPVHSPRESAPPPEYTTEPEGETAQEQEDSWDRWAEDLDDEVSKLRHEMRKIKQALEKAQQHPIDTPESLGQEVQEHLDLLQQQIQTRCEQRGEEWVNKAGQAIQEWMSQVRSQCTAACAAAHPATAAPAAADFGELRRRMEAEAIEVCKTVEESIEQAANQRLNDLLDRMADFEARQNEAVGQLGAAQTVTTQGIASIHSYTKESLESVRRFWTGEQMKFQAEKIEFWKIFEIVCLPLWKRN